MSKFVRFIVKTNRDVIKSRLLYFVRNQSTIIDGFVKSESTLSNRLLYYMFNDSQKKPTQKYEEEGILMNLLNQSTLADLRKYDSQTLLSVFNILAERHTIKKKLNVLPLVYKLNDECCQRLHQLTNKEILSYLFLFMKFIPKKIVEMEFYNLAVEKLVVSRTLDNGELIQLIFFIGLKKKRSNSSKLMRNCLQKFTNEFINGLTTEEICIICNAAFKTSTKIKKKIFLDNILKYLNDNLYLFKDPAILITMLKTIRHNRYQSEDLLATISCTLFFNKTIQYYSFPAICHILALYSDYLFYDENLLNVCTERSMELLKGAYYESKTECLLQPRLKDIKRLLWCLSNLNFKQLNNCDIKDVILPQILKLINTGEEKPDPLTLIEMCLYLWMLDYRAYELIEYSLKEENLIILRALPMAKKAQYNLLTSCIFFEDKDFYKKLNIRPVQNDYKVHFQITKRPLLMKIMENLKQITGKSDVNKFELNCEIPGVNIVGITGYKKNIYKAIHIELLDEYTTLKNVENMPTGLMQLKLRLLEQLDEAVIVMDSEEVESMTDAQLQDVLLDEINFVC